MVQDGYCISKAYDATQSEELIYILKVLKQQKQLILNRLENEVGNEQ
ncbi:MAG: hypothetical protein AAF847_18400 [Bacteroidota bacterium]